MCYARHLCCDGGVGLALQIGIIRIPPYIAFELPPETVLPLAYSSGGSQPEGVAKAGVASFGELITPLALAALTGGKVKATEFQVLAMMGKATQISAFGQDDQGDDGSHSWKGLEPLVVCVGGQMDICLLFKRQAELGEVEIAFQLEPEGVYSQAVDGYWQSDAGLSQLIELFEEALLGYLATDQVPRCSDKGIPVMSCNGAGSWKGEQELAKPLGSGGVEVPFHLREEQGKRMVQQAVVAA